MNTKLVSYDEIKVGNKIFTNGKDNHMFRKLKFEEIEIVKSVQIGEPSKLNNNLIIVSIQFESGNGTYGYKDRVLELAV